MQAAASATAKYQLAVPLVLSSVSPGLAALHAARAHTLHPYDTSLKTTHCPACGASYLDGGHIRSLRSNTKKKNSKHRGISSHRRFLSFTCGVCCHQADLPIEGSKTQIFEQPRKKRRPPANVAASSLSIREPPRGASAVQAAKAVDYNTPDLMASPRSSLSFQTSPPGAVSSLSTSNTLVAAGAKARPKKSSGLHSLLARNKEKRETKSTSLHLSSFLQQLG